MRRCVPGFGSEVTADRHLVDVRGSYHPGWCAPRLVASTAEQITQVFDALPVVCTLTPATTATRKAALLPGLFGRADSRGDTAEGIRLRLPTDALSTVLETVD